MSNRAHWILNAILALLYIPLSFFGFLMGMATVGTIGETNKLIIASYHTFACLGQLSPLVSYAGLFLSHVLFKKEHIRASHFARFLGLIFLATAFLLALALEWIAKFFG